MKGDVLNNIANLLKDPQNTLMIGQVKDMDLSDDRSVLRSLVSTWPDDQEIVARVTWDSVGPDAGFFQFPQVGDLVLVGFSDKDEDSAVILKRFSSKEDTIPVTAKDGSTVLRSLADKKLWLTSPNRINLSRGDSEPSENLVIGQKFKATYIAHLEKLIELVEKLIIQRETDLNHTHTGNLAFPTGKPLNMGDMANEKAQLETLKSDVESIKADDVESEDILSDVAFTEK